MIHTPLHKLLSNQSLILSYLTEKFDIVNFIRWGYDNNLPVLINNRFLHSTSHIYYRSIIVEICTLFDNNKHQSNNFHLLIRPDKKFVKKLDAQAVVLLEKKLNISATFFTQEIKDVRNEEIPHYRFKGETKISLNHKYLNELNCLYKLAEEIIKIAADGVIDRSLLVEYRIKPSGQNLFSLHKLLKKVSELDYQKLWELEQIELDRKIATNLA